MACGSCVGIGIGLSGAGKKDTAGKGERKWTKYTLVSGAPAAGKENSTAGRGLGVIQPQPQQEKGAVAPAPPGEEPTSTPARNALATPPPFFFLPMLTASALALLRAAPTEAKAEARGGAWRAGNATLAWALTSTSGAESSDRPPPPPPLATSAPVSPTTAAVTSEKEGGVAAGVCRCLGTVRSTLAAAAAAGSVAGGTLTFPMDEDSLASVGQLLAVALGHSSAPLSEAGGVAALSCVQDDVRSLVACVFSTLRELRSEATTPGLLFALTPMLEAVLDLPASRCVWKLKTFSCAQQFYQFYQFRRLGVGGTEFFCQGTCSTLKGSSVSTFNLFRFRLLILCVWCWACWCAHVHRGTLCSQRHR